MADYSNFPFSDFTAAEIFALMRESKDIGDTEFVDACKEAIRHNKCRQEKIHQLPTRFGKEIDMKKIALVLLLVALAFSSANACCK